jgi:hypothetical protein
MHTKLKKKLSLLLVLVLVLSLLPGLSINAAAETTATLAFASDVHHDTDNKQNNIDVWMKNIQSKGAASHIDYMGFCGDMGSAYDSGTTYWSDVQAVFNVMDGYVNAKYIDKAEYTMGNHEWFTEAGGNYGLYNNNTEYPAAAATCSRFLRIGESERDDEYITYCFGSWGEVAADTSKYGFGEADINTLATYLSSAPTDIPIFIMSHYPLHSFGGRNMINADDVITLLNQYPNVVFVYGHNHSVFDTYYDQINEAGDYLDVSGTPIQIKFTYTSAGCMSDSEYGAGSHFVQGKGLIAKIDGSAVTLTHYKMDGTPTNDQRIVNIPAVYNEAGPFVVKFKDGHTNQMLSYQTVASGTSATEPSHVKYDGYIYMGWDKDFSNITQNITVTATYIEKPEPLAQETALDPNYVYITLYEGDSPARSSKANGTYDIGSPIVLYPIPFTPGMKIDDAVIALHELAYADGTAGLSIFSDYGFDCFSKIWGHTPVHNTLAFTDSGYVDAAIEAQGGSVYYLLAYDSSWITTSFITPDITNTETGKYITMQAKTMSMNSDYTYTPKGYAGDIYVGKSIDSLADTGINSDEKGVFTISFNSAGTYYVMAKSSAGGDAVAVVNVTDNSGKHVYVNLSVDGQVKYDQNGNYIAYYPMVLSDGDTINDIMTELHAYAYGKGSAWTTYEVDSATKIYCVWGLDKETNCASIYLNNDNEPVSASKVLQDGDVINVNAYSGAYERASMFDIPYREIGVDDPVTLTAVSKGYDASSYTYDVRPSTTLIKVNFKDTYNDASYTTDVNGKVTLQFSTEGTYIVTGNPTNVTVGDVTYSVAPPVSVFKVGNGGPRVIYQIAVTGITGLPTNGLVGTPLALSGTVAPAGATFKTISWSVKSGSATISDGNKLTATASGNVVVTATITNGISKETGTDYTKDFTIGFSRVSTGTQIGTVYFFAATDKNLLKDTGNKDIVYYPIPICEGDTIADAISKLHQQAYGNASGWGYETIATYGLVLNKLWGNAISTSSMTYGGGVWTSFTGYTHCNVLAPATDGMIITLSSTADGSGIRTGFFDKQYINLTAGESLTLTFRRSSGDAKSSLCTGAEVFVDGVSVGTTGATGTPTAAMITIPFNTPGKYVVTGAGGTSWTKAACVVNVTPASFTAVADITGVPATGTVGTPLTLTGTVEPSNATNQTIAWSVKSGSATISDGNKLTASVAGEVVVTATIANGAAVDQPFTKDCTITFTEAFVAVNNIDLTGIPTTGTVGTPVTLTGTVEPSNATNQTITWSVKSGSAAISGGNKLTASAAGQVVITATIANGAAVDQPYTKDYTITFTAASSGGGGGGGGNDTGSGTKTGTVETTDSGNTTTSTVTITGSTSGGTTSVSVDNKTMNDLIKSSQTAENAGKGSEVLISVTTGSSTDKVSLTIPAGSFGQLADNTDAALTVSSGIGTITFDSNAVDSIKAAAGTGDVSVSIQQVKTSSLPAETQQQIGNRPVYDFSVTSKGTEISSFGGASVSVSVPYTLAPGEDPNGIVIYHISSTGSLVPIPNCVYDPVTKQVTFMTTHFSKYAVIYKDIKFTDVSGWSENYINYLAARGIINGSGSGTFNPDGKITRAQFVTILANLANADLSKYTASSFKDVSTGDWYFAAVQWASENGIVLGSNGNFNPNDNITRQDLAVILTRYAENIGYKLPETNAPATFSDSAEIAPYAAAAVKAVQTAGIITGYTDGCFNPHDFASRAEAAKMIAVFIKGMLQ